ncbi:MAG: AAA family ATPase [Eubacterium sp.]|nr:AAA family ATPase [Eubacterium sp.]
MIGRNKEIAELEELYERNRAELVAVYGRRRVGKTYLIEQVFKNRFSFRHAGLSPIEHEKNGMLSAQLHHFYNSLRTFGREETDEPTNWLDAFFMLQQLLEKKDDGSRQVVFIDEMPWLDTARSGFITAFEGFWNNWGCHRENLMVIVCGSANSWMQDKLINNHGGLYGRVTYEIKLIPFTLAECEDFFKQNNISITRYDIAQSYMIVGGIPYYLGYFKRGLSLAQNVDNLFFNSDAKLKFEFDRLFQSALSSPELAKSVVNFLYNRNAGYTRAEITTGLGIKDGGAITSCLNALVAGDYIIKYVPFGMKKKQEHYKLVDPFCLFYLRFVSGRSSLDNDFWVQSVKSRPVEVWRGLAFENLCFNHIAQIKKALGISGVITRQSAWSKRSDDEEGVQIDLLIDRNDNVINMCEIKFYSDDFTVDKDYYRVMLRRQDILLKMVSKTTAIHSTLITTFGLKHNEYSGVFTNAITLEELFD